MKNMIFVALFAALLVIVGCEKYETPSHSKLEGVTVGEGQIKMSISLDNLDFGSQAVTKSSVKSSVITTTREVQVKNMKVFVFDRRGLDSNNPSHGKLLEVRDVIKDYNAIGQPTYYAVVEERDYPVAILGISNITAESFDDMVIMTDDPSDTTGYFYLNSNGEVSFIEGEGEYVYTDFLQNIMMEYTLDNNVLKNTPSNTGYLPAYAEFNLEMLTQEYLDANPPMLEAYYSFARIDIILTDMDRSANLVSVRAIDAPQFAPNPITGIPHPTKIETHEVTPITNIREGYGYSKFPTGITEANYTTKYLQGLYIYPTAPLANAPESVLQADNDPVYLLLQVDVNGTLANESDDVYYKLMIRYSDSEGKESYFVNNSVRYLVNISKLNTDGYPSIDEARLAPPSNVDYDITIDDQSTNIVNNGQYYLGVDNDNYVTELVSTESNMLYINPSFETISSNHNSIVVNGDNVEMLLQLTYNASGDNPTAHDSILFKNLTKEVFADGITYEYVGGANFSGDVLTGWDEDFGTHTIKLTMPISKGNGSIEFRVGELRREVNISLTHKTIITDYTNRNFINELLTGSKDIDAKSGVANSYILNMYDDALNVYYIPVAERINDYWINYSDGNPDNINVSQYNWLSDFDVKATWFDGVDLSGVNISMATSPTGYPAVKVTVDPNVAEYQNIGFNVVSKDSGNVVWSWHLWITDYNPYITSTAKVGDDTKGARPSTTTQGIAIETINGEVHRYSGDIWSSGHYANSVMMDRNIGSIGQFSEPKNKGALYYQFGRKDPFFGREHLSDGKESISTQFTKSPEGGAKWGDYSFVVEYVKSVLNPTTFYHNQFVTTGDKGNWVKDYNGATLMWNDYKSNINNNRKSIFDPSPLGWMIPQSEAWSDLAVSGSHDSSTNVFSYPLSNSVASYHATDCVKVYWNGVYYAGVKNSNIWACNPNVDSSDPYSLINGKISSEIEGRMTAMQVRPVRE